MGGLAARIRAAVLSIMNDPERIPQIDRLAFYEAKVLQCAADGKTLDVMPLDKRVADGKTIAGVRFHVPAAGAVQIVKAGGIVLIGWERGDPQRIFALPAFHTGAALSELQWNADMVYLGAKAGAAFIARADLVQSRFNQLYNAVNGAGVDAQGAIMKASLLSALSGITSSVATTQSKAK